MSKTVLTLLGPIGSGKSTTGNWLLNHHVFTSGRDIAAVTREIQRAEYNNLIVLDCPGFGDTKDEDLFFRQFLINEQKFLKYSPISAFLMVVKFDLDKSEGFYFAARDFVSAFGPLGIKSLVLLCIQSNPRRRYSQSHFENILKTSDGYRYLNSNNRGKEIEWCLWENLENIYPDQRNNLNKCLHKVDRYKKEYMEMAIQMIKNKLNVY